jgi:hypothetical protein
MREIGTAPMQPSSVIDGGRLIEPRTLAETLDRKKLTNNETRAVIAADALRISFTDKQGLVAAHILSTEPMGALRAVSLLGLGSVDEVVAARDQTRTNPEHHGLWIQHQALTADPMLTGVVIYKRVHMCHSDIAKKIGTDIKTVEIMALKLADLGITERSIISRGFNEFCEKVRAADSGSVQLPTKELATALKSDAQRVCRARRRNRMQDKESTSGKAEAAESASRIRRTILANPGISDAKLAKALGLTERQVGWQRLKLYNEGKLPRWRSPGLGKDGVIGKPSRRLVVKQLLSKVVNSLSSAEKPVSAAELYRNGYPEFRTVSISTLRTLLAELVREGSVPPRFKSKSPSGTVNQAESQ